MVWYASKFTKPFLPFLFILQSICHLLKEISDYILLSLPCGIYEVEPQDISFQSVHSSEGVMGKSAEETFVQIHPEVLQVGEVRTTDTLHYIIHNAIHLGKWASLNTIPSQGHSPHYLTLNPLSLSSLFSSSNCFRVLVNPLYTKYSLTASSSAPAAAVIAKPMQLQKLGVGLVCCCAAGLSPRQNTSQGKVV